MANNSSKKKNTRSNKKTNKSGTFYRKKQTVRRKGNQLSKNSEITTGFDGDFMHIFRVVAISSIVFCLFYLLTVFLTGQYKVSPEETKEAEISYTEIIAGRSFSMSETDYLVLYYDYSDEDLVSAISTAVSTYRSKVDTVYTVYKVDMSDALNKKYVSETSNQAPETAADILINGPTLIHFHEGAVAEYIEGKDSVVDYLS